MASTAAKIVTGVGAAILLLAGGCFVLLTDALGSGGSDPTLLTVTIVVLTGGVLATTAFLGLVRDR